MHALEADSTDCHAFNLCCLNAVSLTCQSCIPDLVRQLSILGGLLDFVFFPTSSDSRVTESAAFISTVCDIVAAYVVVDARFASVVNSGTALFKLDDAVWCCE
jgi:hypothetical protein